MKIKRRILIKIGGKVFEKSHGFHSLAKSIAQSVGAEYIIVHGGGVEITQALQAANRPTRFENGLRITAAEDMAIIEQVLSGNINARIADILDEHSVKCIRLSGRSEALLTVEPLTTNGYSLGFVGKIVQVNPSPVISALESNLVPVVSPVSADAEGNSYNVNADSAAAAIAIHTHCTDLIYFSDVAGIHGPQGMIPDLSLAEADSLVRTGVIRDGMVAKLQSISEALSANVKRVHVTSWQGDETLLLMVKDGKINGTTVHR